MENAKHTPGPWETGTQINGSTTLVARIETGFVVAEMRNVYLREEAEANARLIATAPDHHANAEDTVKYSIPKVENGRVVGYIVPIEIIERHKAAIAKAEGK